MLKFLGVLVLLTTAFATGFYIGRHSMEDLTKTVAATVTDFSKNLVETTAGLERSLRERQGLVEAKAHVIQARAEVMDRNFGSAAKALVEARNNLEHARKEENSTEHRRRITAVIGRIQPLERELAAGKSIPRARLEELQKEVDALASR